MSIGASLDLSEMNLIAHPLISGLNPVWRSMILGGIPLFFVLYMICRFRFADKELKRTYLKNNGLEFRLATECKQMAKSPEFHAELLLFMSLNALFLIFLGTGVIGSGFDAPLYAVILSGMIVFLTFTGAFLIFDFFLWLLIHKKWLKESAALRT